MTCVLGYSNQIDISALSGGSWNTNYPLANLQNRYLWQKARSNNALAGSTVLDIALVSVQKIGVIALSRHNFSDIATVRIQASSSATMSPLLYDSGAETIYSGTDYAKSFPSIEARYWRISIVDTANVNGFIEFGRVFIGWRFSPTNNIDWNASFAVESTTNVVQALAGPEYFDERPNRRVWQGKWSWLDDYEAYRVMLTIQRSQDISREVYLIEDDTDVSYRDLRSFLGRFKQLSAIEWPYVSQHSVGVEISEVL